MSSDVTIIRWEDTSGATVHLFAQAAGKWTGRLARHGITGHTAARSDEFTTLPDGSQEPSGFGFGTRQWTVQYEVAGTTKTTHNDNLMLLKGEIRGMVGRTYWLVYDENGTRKKIEAVPGGIVPANMPRFVYTGNITIVGSRAYTYTATTTASAAGAMNSTPYSWSVVNDGYLDTDDCTLVLTPTTTKTASTGQRYTRVITPVNRSPAALVDWPFEITADIFGGVSGWDHATLVTGSKSRSDGADVEVYVDGRRVDRWWYSDGGRGPNTSTANIWIRLNLPARRTLTLAQACTDVDTTLYVVEDLPETTVFPMPLVVVNGGSSEIMLLTAQDPANKSITVTRNARETASSAYSAGQVMFAAPVTLRIVYGQTTGGTAQRIDDRYKPMVIQQDATTPRSTNARWYWNYFMQTLSGDAMKTLLSAQPRGGSWRPVDGVGFNPADRDLPTDYVPSTVAYTGPPAGGTPFYFTNTDPASKIGIVLGKASGVNPYANAWRFDSCVPLKEVTYTAKLVVGASAAVPTDFIAESVTWFGQVQQLASVTRSTAGTTTSTATKAFNDLGGAEAPARAVQFRFPISSPGGSSDGDSGWYVDDVDVQFATNQSPVVVWGDEYTCYQFGRPDVPMTIANTLGQTIKVYGPVVPLGIGGALTINLKTGAVTATDADGIEGTGDHLVKGTLGFRIPLGTNNLTVTDVGQKAVTVTYTIRGGWA